MGKSVPRSPNDYTVACICPMGIELAAVKAMLDQIHPGLPVHRDQNGYVLGELAGHDVVVAVLPGTGTNAAATTATQLLNDFPAVRFSLLVGIGGGVPDDETEGEDANDIRLGDVVVSKPTSNSGGVVQYDLGKHTTQGGWERTGFLNKPPALLRSKVEQLAADHLIRGNEITLHLSAMFEKYPMMTETFSHQGVENDLLFRMDRPHPSGRTCRDCDRQWLVLRKKQRKGTQPKIHYGTIGSANAVVKDALLREQLRRDMQILCVEMEAAGIMNDFPCLVIRGICDYADSHKNKRWQGYAAAVAAAYMKELLAVIVPDVTESLTRAVKLLEISEYDHGLNLFTAPEIDAHQFIGRKDVLEQMFTILQPGIRSDERKVLVLGGLGGIGKTQLAISYAKHQRTLYSSIFWLNASSEMTLQSSFRLIAKRVGSLDASSLKDDQVLTKVLNWLSAPDNNRWLLIFDNYDDPGQFKINNYYP